MQCIICLQFSCSVMSNSLRPRGLQHARLPCCSLSPGVCLNSYPLSQWLTISFSVAPLLLLPSIFPRIRVFSNELALHIRWPKYWSFSFNISPSNSGLISIRIDWFDPPAVQGTLKSLLRTTVWKHQFFGPQPSLWFNSHICTWLLKKTTALTIWTYIGKVMSLILIRCLGLS